MKHLAKHKLRNGMDVRCGQHRCTKCGKQFAHAAVLASHARIVHPGHLYSWFCCCLSPVFIVCLICPSEVTTVWHYRYSIIIIIIIMYCLK